MIICIYIYPWSWRLGHSGQQTSTQPCSGLLGASFFGLLSWSTSARVICRILARFWGILGCLGLWFEGLFGGKLFFCQVMFRLDETRLFEILDDPFSWPFGHICSGSNLFDTFGRFFVIMFANVSKPIPIPRDPRFLKSTKIKLRPFSAALGSPWPPKCVPRTSKWCSEEVKIGVWVGSIAANGYQCLYITVRPGVKHDTPFECRTLPWTVQ